MDGIMDYSKFISSIKLFEEKLTKLKRGSFLNQILTSNSGIKLSFTKNDEGKYDSNIERFGPNDEQIDAFVLTIRFFLQDNEQSSLRNLKTNYENSGVEEPLKQEFFKLRDGLNNYLDEKMPVLLSVNGQSFSNQDILHTYLFGELAHSNSEKKKVIDSMRNTPMLLIFKNSFVSVLTIFFQYLEKINKVNLRVLESI